MSKLLETLQALANQERLKIIEILSNRDEVNLEEFSKILFMDRRTAAYHLQILFKIGILKSRKLGRKLFFSMRSDYKL